MNRDLINKILRLDNFIIEKMTIVDDTTVYIRPLYIELLSLYPGVQRELAKDISYQIKKLFPEVIYTVEASILPLASLVSQELDIPLSIIRKPRNFKHEDEEPKIYIADNLKNKPAILLDDAVWSGYTMHHVFKLFQDSHIPWPKCYFVFDLLNFNEGGKKLAKHEREFLKTCQSWITYRDIVESAYGLGIISEDAYSRTMALFHDDSI